MVRIFPDNINPRLISKAVDALKKDGVLIIPTDTVYALACSLKSRSAFERICSIKKIKPSHANFSIAFSDFSSLASYTRPFSREVFRVMKNCLPGPFTFILMAGTKIPEVFRSNKKTIGIRIPANNIVSALIAGLESPVVVSSLRSEDEISDYYSNPDEIERRYGEQVDLIVDGGNSDMTPSTVIDCTSDIPVVLREGKGKIGVH